jgi:chaperonin cofactor prefoldin
MKDNWKQFLKLLMGTGMLLVDTDRRERVSSTLRDRMEDLRETASDRYDEAMNRVERLADVVRGRRSYAAPVGGFLLGLGVGVGLGVLFAPASGEETRENLRDQASNLKDRVSQQAANLRGRASEKVSEIQDQVREATGSQTPYSRPA